MTAATGDAAAYTFVADSMAKRFGQNHVLKAASLWARPGEVTLLVGRNGVGKSTLLRSALGLVRPDHGTVVFRGLAYLRPKLHRLARRGLFYLPDRDLLSPRLTVGQHLRAASRLDAGWAADPWPSQADIEVTFAVGELRQRRSPDLSIGERRRVELAVAGVRRPACLLADEPFREIAPVDVTTASSALRGFADAGCAVVVTGHEVGPLFALADRLIWMTAGTTRELGTPREAGSHPEFRREYLGLARETPQPPRP